RKEIAGKYPDLNYINLIHPSCVIFDTVKMGIGNVIMPLVVINSNAVLGNHCIINSASVVEHDCVLGDFVHVSPNATLCGKVQVNECTHLGAASVVKNNINICGNCVIGAGSTVIADIENPGVYVGLISKKYLNQNRL
ncbi:MAG: acetyltransferase, partial [Clostridia bacterium]|nr:acetyltransferase [Clostridia bacterium]